MKEMQSKNAFFPKLPFCPGILAKRNPGIGRLLILIGIAMLVVSRAEAQGVYYWGADKMVFYKQTENAQVPTEIKKYAVFGEADITGATATSFTVSTVKSFTLKGIGEEFFGIALYKTHTALNAAFPVGDAYKFTAHGGSLQGESNDLPINADAYPQIAYLIDGGLKAARNASSTSDLTLTWKFNGIGPASTNVSFAIGSKPFVIPTQGYWSDFVGAGHTTVTIPYTVLANMLPNIDYYGMIVNYNESSVTTGGSFSSAENFDGFQSITYFVLRVVN
jgi:hypothetical protein